ncbi:AraC family transcriptional regulator [Paenibacillus abyssi]|uniref:HTH araC/xylS-type domain-containing protein n=1 Tax=Paenibacillus abyssi TaxID=1340531 RepID=A0A917D3N9_9BACL|nr:AraC family transcriptional regulator [Paenibacillus abyssi]GGG08817.1 hypothetical protein GCM10010916_27070 [Paenibacillus abyssi]
MTRIMDDMISSYPIRLIGANVDRSRLRVKTLQLVSAGHLPGRTLQRKDAVFERWAFVYITGGQGYYQVNKEPRKTVEAGSLFCLYPGAVFQYGSDDGGYWDEYYFTVEGTRVQEWLDGWSIQPDSVMSVGCDDSYFSRMEMLFSLMESGTPVHLDRAALLLESFLYELTHKLHTAESRNRTGAHHHIIDDLSNSVYDSIAPSDFAARHHISLSTLRRIVYFCTGYPLNEFIHRLKAAEAKRILLNTDDSVKEISSRLGYNDVFYFSRLFKKYVGVAPKIFRRQIGL